MSTDPASLRQKLLELRQEAIRRKDVQLLGRIDGLLAVKPRDHIEAVAWVQVARNILRDARAYRERRR